MKQDSRNKERSPDLEMEWLACGSQQMLIKKCPTNGNCLFEAIRDQIYKLGIPVARQWSQLELRERIADHILAFLPNFSQQIISNIQEMNYDPEATISYNAIQNYVNQIKENHFWGGAESIKAASEILNAKITIFQTNGTRIPFGPISTRYSIKLLYRQIGPNSGCNHYDSVRTLRNPPSTPEQQKISKTGPSMDSIANILSTSPLKQNLYPTNPLDPSCDRIIKHKEQQQRFESRNLTKLKIGTWNIRGCIKERKKDDLCQTLNNEGLDIACIQETHLSTGQQLSPNYTWFLSGGSECKVNRGVAILVNTHKDINPSKFTPYSENIASCVIETRNHTLNIITCHMPCDSSKESKDNFHLLSRIIAEHSKTGIPTIIAGDFNAHIGYTDIQKETSGLIGKKINHKESNKNGEYLKDIILLHSLNLSTSWSQSNSVLVTWTNGTSKSQLDHILCANGAPDTRMWCKAKWITDINTDHKLVYAALIIKNGPKTNPTLKKIQKQRWNIERLKVKEDKEKYKARIKARLAELKEQNINTPEVPPKNDRWEQLCEIIKDSAHETLNTPSSPMTPKRRKALADQQRARFRKNKFPNNPELTQDLKQANTIREIRQKDHEINKCSKFFKDIATYHPIQRMRHTYKYLKQFNRKSSKKKKYIPMAQWEKTLHNPENQQTVQPLKEIATVESFPPPSHDKIIHLIQNYKKGTAPGLDKINIELLQESPYELIEELTQIITQAWNLNIIPEAWTHTIQTPIPKIPSPGSTDDYRRITLCSVAYKIYAKFLLEVLDKNMTPIPQYQAAFLANRSTDDHIYTARRLLEEAWREGKILYVMALDLAKAFDTVEHKALVTILKHRGVPIFLINRIISACIHEKTAIQWFGQTTKFHNKSKGVKQGCPISPRLFTIVLHEVISTTTETLSKFTIQESSHLSIPTLLAYADDLLVISDNTNDLDELLQEITPNLESTGLHLNFNKCEIMIRDPYNPDPTDIPKYLIINQTQIKVVQTLKYLGSFLTNHLNRRGTTRTRIEKALKSARMIIPFLQQHKPPWNIIRSIYNTMIVPVAIYGLKATAMTSVNRRALKHMEKLTLSLLAQHCRRTPSLKITALLKGKTIWRKLMVQRIKYWGHILRRPSNNILQAASRVRPVKRKVGRPCDTWITNLDKDIMRSQIPKKTWLEKAKEKKELAKQTEDIYKITNSSDEEEITIL